MTDFNEQMKKMFQPSTDLFTANAKILETAVEQQSTLVKSFIASSIDFNKQLGEQKDYSNVQKMSEEFGKSITEQVTTSNKKIAEAITSATEESSKIINTLVDNAKQTAS